MQYLMKFQKMVVFSLFISLSILQDSYAKLLIITTAYNRPDFIEIQERTFKKFLKEDYLFMVFNDADKTDKELAIRTTCEGLGVTCIRVPQNCHNVDPQCHHAPASFRHGESMHFAFENYGFKHDDIVLLIDSDVFLTHPMSAREFLGDFDAYTPLSNKELKPQLCFINMPKLQDRTSLNFRAGFLDGSFMDAGHFTRYYCAAHPEFKVKIGTIVWGLHRGGPADLNLDKSKDIVNQLRDMGYTPLEVQLIKSMIDVCNANPVYNVLMDCNIGFYETNLFLDYKHGSEWHGPNAKIKALKDKLFKDFISELLK